MKTYTVPEWAIEQGVCVSHARNLLNVAHHFNRATKRKRNGVYVYGVIEGLTKDNPKSVELGTLDK